ncbi:MAG TPA: ABC transporter substrate-binding protein [Nitrospirae bacterium]|nr:ABC transporter substrate-binding protein [Nitrospirota bacterium]HDZ03395.1 ABC transporter substrate-binding protein [Nitrospirota bacterium]
MKKTVKAIGGVIITVAVILSGYMFTGCEKSEMPAAKKETVKIGMVLPLTGGIAFIGVGMRNAAILAKEHLGDTKYNYEILFEDDQYNPKLTASAANKFINVDKVDAIVSCEASPGQVVSALARKNEIIHFGLTAVSSVAEGDNNFVHWTPAKEQARVLVKELKKQGIKTMGIFRSVSLQDWTAYVDAVRELSKDAGIKIVTEHSFQDSQKDFRSMIAKAKQTNPDIYFLVVPTPAIELLVKQIREAGIKTPLTSIESFEVTETPELFEGYYYVSSSEPTSGFRSAYEAKFNESPPICSANSYDMINLIVTAIESIDSPAKPTTTEISRALKNIRNFPGALGPLSVGDDGIVISSAQLKTIKDGKPTPVGH